MRIGIKSKIAVSVLVASLALTGCEQSLSSEEHLSSAKLSLENGDVNAAIIHLKNVLKVDANHAVGRFLLGKSYIQQGAWVRAEKELEKAYESGFEPNEVIPVLAKVYYHLNNQEALTTLLEKSPDASEEVLTVVKTFLAMTYVTAGDYEQGKIFFQDIIEANLPTKHTQLSLAWQYGMDRDIEQALNVIEQILEEDKKFSEAIAYRGYLYYSLQDMEKAAEAFGEYLTIHNKDTEVRIMYGLALAGAGQYEAAEKQADFLLKISKYHAHINQIKAQARFSAKDFDNAKLFADVAIQGNNELVIPRIVAGISAYQLNQPEVAYQNLNAIKNQITFEHPAKRLLVALRFQLGYEKELFTELSQVKIDEIDTELLSSSANELFRLGNAEEANFLLAKASKKEPENAELYYQQGILKLLNNDESATKFFELALAKNPELDSALTMLVVEHLKNKEFDKALEVSYRIKESKPELSNTLQGIIYKEQGDLKSASKAFERVLSVNEANAGVLFKLGEIAEQNNDVATAIDYYQQVLKIDMKVTVAVTAILKHAKNEKYQESIERFFEERMNHHKADAVSSLAFAGYKVIHNDIAAALTIIASGLEVEPKNIKLLMFKGKLHANLNEYDEAIRQFDKAFEQDPNNAMPMIAKAKIFELQGSLNNAIREQEKAIDASPNSLGLALNLVKLHIENRNLKAASKVISNLKTRNQSHIGIDRFEGKIAFHEGDFIKAEKLLKKVYLQRKSEAVLLELVTTLQGLNRSNEALEIINELEELSKNPLPLDVLLKQAELYEKEQPLKAVAVYKFVAERTNRNFVMLNNLALLYMELGEKDKALSHAEAAYNKAPEATAIQNTYGLILLYAQKNKEALKYLEQAYQANETNVTYRIHYAQALSKNNRKKEAEQLIANIEPASLNENAFKRWSELSKALQL